MKFLCLAYGDEKDWNALTKKQQDELLEQDEACGRGSPLQAPQQALYQLDRIRTDTYLGMAFSNIVAFFIILITPATLHGIGSGNQLETFTAITCMKQRPPLSQPFTARL